MAKVMTWDYPNYELIGTPDYHVFRFKKAPVLEPLEVQLSDGTVMRPGEYFVEFNGDNGSAFYQGFCLTAGALRYEGAFTDEKGTIVCFTHHMPDDQVTEYAAPAARQMELFQKPASQMVDFFGFKLMLHDGCTEFMWVTPAVAPRVAETFKVVRGRDAEGNMASKRLKKKKAA